VPTAAFAGDVAMSALWNQLGQSIEQLTAHCGMLADTDVSQLVTMSNAMAEIRARWDAQASTPTIGIVVVPTAPMTVPPAETCRIMDTNGDGVTDQCVPVNMIP